MAGVHVSGGRTGRPLESPAQALERIRDESAKERGERERVKSLFPGRPEHARDAAQVNRVMERSGQDKPITPEAVRRLGADRIREIINRYRRRAGRLSTPEAKLIADKVGEEVNHHRHVEGEIQRHAMQEHVRMQRDSEPDHGRRGR